MIEIRISHEASDEILNKLKDYNDHYQPQVNYKPVIFYAENDGKFMGGLEGFAAWDMFEISNFYVENKNQGLGTELIKKVEDYAHESGLNKIIASTIDFQAPSFYKKMGFELFAKVPNYAGEYACNFFIKRL